MLLSKGPSLKDTTFLHVAMGISSFSWMPQQKGHRDRPHSRERYAFMQGGHCTPAVAVANGQHAIFMPRIDTVPCAQGLCLTRSTCEPTNEPFLRMRCEEACAGHTLFGEAFNCGAMALACAWHTMSTETFRYAGSRGPVV